MPNCRHCGSRLTRFDKDMCPVCGCKHPFEGVHQDTLDITQQIESVDPKEVGAFQRKKKSKAFIYSLAGGWFGLPFLYLQLRKTGIIYSISLFIANLILFIAVLFGAKCAIWIPIVICLGLYLVSDLILGLVLILIKDLKDGRGEYLE